MTNSKVYAARYVRPENGRTFLVAFNADSKQLAREHAKHMASDIGGRFVQLVHAFDGSDVELGVVVDERL